MKFFHVFECEPFVRQVSKKISTVIEVLKGKQLPRFGRFWVIKSELRVFKTLIREKLSMLLKLELKIWMISIFCKKIAIDTWLLIVGWESLLDFFYKTVQFRVKEELLLFVSERKFELIEGIFLYKNIGKKRSCKF